MQNCFLSKIDFLDGISLGDKHQIPNNLQSGKFKIPNEKVLVICA
jgi:hypothetical protein